MRNLSLRSRSIRRVLSFPLRGVGPFACRPIVLFWLAFGLAGPALAQQTAERKAGAPESAPASIDGSAAAVPVGYRIGPDDVLTIVFWRDKDMSGDVIVRPDGKISVPLLNDIDAAGLTPEQLRERLEAGAAKLVRDPKATVVVRQVNSLKVFITGEVTKPGGYAISGRMTVLQLIAMAGGLLEYADREHIVVVRNENGAQTSFRFNYKDVSQQKHVNQNMELRPGDTVLVP